MTKAQRDILRKRRVLEHAERTGNVCKRCRYFGVSRSVFDLWRKAYETHGDAGLVNKKPCPVNLTLRTPPEIVEKVLHLRRTYHLGPIRIVWYLERYHGIKISDAGVYRILRRHGLNRLPNRVGRRVVHTHRYAKQVPGHHVQVDVRFLILRGKHGERRKKALSRGWPQVPEWVFCSTAGTPWEERNFNRLWYRLRRRAQKQGVRPLKLHTTRHTWATFALHAGKSVRWVADQLGHADPALTLRTYAHALREEETDLSFAEFGGPGRPYTAPGFEDAG